MKIAVISHNYYPEDSGIGLYTTEMAEYLAKNHTVNVITGFPYYPQWKIAKEYAHQNSFIYEEINNVSVYRFKQYTPQQPSFLKRILQMLHFFTGSIVNLFKIPKIEAVIVVVPFTFSIILGWILKVRYGAKLIIHTQDFEFDAAIDSGLLNGKKLLKRGIGTIERFLYNRADKASTISGRMLQKLAQKTNKPKMYFPNWVDENTINPRTANTHSIFDSTKYNILYSGNIGAKQDWEFFLEVVAQCKDYINLYFTLVGDGAMKDYVVEKIQDLPNIEYHPPVEYKELNDVLCTADLHILFQKVAVEDTVMPSKILGMMASAKPSIITGNPNSEVKKQILESGGGFYFDDGKPETVVQKIVELSTSITHKAIGEKARNFIIENFSSQKVLSNFEKELLRL